MSTPKLVTSDDTQYLCNIKAPGVHIYVYIYKIIKLKGKEIEDQITG